MKASGRTAQKGRRWISQALKCLRELLPVVAESRKKSRKRNLQRLRAAEAKCNELQHRWGPRAAEEDGRVRWTPRSAHLSSQEETPVSTIPQNRRGTSSVHGPPTSKEGSGRGTSTEARNRDRLGAANPTRVAVGGRTSRKQRTERSAVLLEARRQGSLSADITRAQHQAERSDESPG